MGINPWAEIIYQGRAELWGRSLSPRAGKAYAVSASSMAAKLSG